MRLKSFLLPLALAGTAGLAAQPALAGPSGYPVQAPPVNGYYGGTFILRGGAAYVEPDEDAYSNVEFFDVLDPNDEVVTIDSLVDVDLDDDTTWQIGGTYIFTDHFAVELYHANDASFEASLFSDAFLGDEFIGDFSEGLGDFDTYVTSLFFNWFFLDPSCLVQPYVGIGMTYVDIEEDFVRELGFTDPDTGDIIRHGRLGFGSDFSWTAQVGVDFRFGHDSNWLVNLSAMYVDAQPDLYLGFDTDTLPPGFIDPVALPYRIRREMDLDPWIVNLGLGYKFSF